MPDIVTRLRVDDSDMRRGASSAAVELSRVESASTSATSSLLAQQAEMSRVAVGMQANSQQTIASLKEQQEEFSRVDLALDSMARKAESLARVADAAAVVAVKGRELSAAVTGDRAGMLQAALTDRIVDEPRRPALAVAASQPSSQPSAAPVATSEPEEDSGVGSLALHVGASALARSAMPGIVSAAPTAISSLATFTGISTGAAIAVGTLTLGLATAVLAFPALAAAGEFADRQLAKFTDSVNSAASGARLQAAEIRELTSAAQSYSLGSERSFTQLGDIAGATLQSRKQLVGDRPDSKIAGTTAVSLAAESLPIVERFETVTGLSATESAKQQAALIAGYQAAGKSAAESLQWQRDLNDVLTVGSRLANTGADQLAAKLVEIAPAAERVGWSLASTTAAVATLEQRGLDSSRLTSSLDELRQVGISNRDQFADLGIAITDASGRLAPVESVSRQVSVAMRGLDEEQRKSQLSALGLSEQTAATVAALSMMPQAVDDARAAITGASGASEKLAASLRDDYDAAWKANTSSIGSLAQSFGQLFNQAKEYTLTPILEQTGWTLQVTADAVQWGSEKISAAAAVVHDNWTTTTKAFDAAREAAVKLGLIDPPKPIAIEVTPPKPVKVELSTEEKKLDENPARLKTVADHEQRIRLLDAALASNTLTAEAHANAVRVHREAIDAATGGTQKLIEELQRETAAIGQTVAETERLKLTRAGATAETALGVQEARAEKLVAMELNANRERSIALMQTEAEQRRAKLAGEGLNTAQVDTVDSDRLRVDTEKELARLARERIALGQTEAEQRRAKLADEGHSQQDIDLREAAREMNDVRKDEVTTLKELDEAYEKLLFSKTELRDRDESRFSPEAQAEVKLRRERNEELEKEQKDKKLAAQLTEKLDPTLKLRQEREELDRLRDARQISDDTHAKGVADIEKRWKQATQSVREHQAALNEAADFGSGAAQKLIAQAISLGQDAQPQSLTLPSPVSSTVNSVATTPAAPAPLQVAQPTPAVQPLPTPALDKLFADEDGFLKQFDRLSEAINALQAAISSQRTDLERIGDATRSTARETARFVELVSKT